MRKRIAQLVRSTTTSLGPEHCAHFRSAKASAPVRALRVCDTIASPSTIAEKLRRLSSLKLGIDRTTQRFFRRRLLIFCGIFCVAQVMHNPSSSGPSAKSKVGASQASEASLKRKRGVFQKDLQHMMYGFGDDTNPLPETVSLVEDIVVEYITDMVHKAQNIASKRGRLLTEDFLYLIRKDPPKLHRCTELLSMHEELKLARKAFDVNEENLATAD
ncbi:transcription initiation factor TFIID subunit 13 [Canna indica]|uniref:Transcription initiation factor TFIID subunit 13 n=1 Tax=Canna indica TaxID=4628 RepID=A0AAQ3Q1H8_9LILI|nr:transcription initiation factor TFIID subunit 13 [Canna indica]